MHVQLLGPFRVIDGGHPVHLSPQQRALLAVLILAPDQPVDHEYVRRRLWPGGGDKAATLRQCVTELRKRLPDNLPKGNEPGLIRITIARQDVDYFRFQGGVATAGSQRGAARAETLRAALAEWHGEPLGDVKNAYLREEKARLTKEWVKAVEDLLRVLEEIDRRAFLRELRAARRRWPEDPSLFAIDLRRRFADRNPDARQFYMDWVREHGRPSRPIQRLYEELTRGSVPGPAGRPAPRQLPAHRPSLVGRAAQLDELSEALLTDDPAASRAVVVTGMPGVGKTQLVQYWADRMADSFPDGTLYADLNGFGSREAPEQPGQILVRLLNDLGVEPPVPTLDGMITAYRTALSARRALVVLDNARDVRQVRPLLPGNGPCAAVVTSRDRLEQLQVHEHVREIRVGPLTHADAVALLVADLGAARTRDAGAHLDEIAMLCGRLPLALSVVAARLRTRRWEDLADIAASLRDERTRLDTLGHRTDDLNVRAALNTSYRALSATAADLLARLALHPGPTIGWKAVVALCGDVQRAVRVADELVAASLLDDPAPDRYALHDLVRLYASESAQILRPADRADATDRVFQYLLHNTHACDRVLAPDRQLPIVEPDGFEAVAPATVEEVMHWLDAEYATVTAAIRRAYALGHDGYTWQLALVLVTYQWRTGRYADAERYLSYAVQAADRSAGAAVRALARRTLGGSLRGLGDRARAKIEIAQAVALAEQGGDELGTALGRQRLALLHREMGEPQAAAKQYTLALADFRRLRIVDGEAHALAGLSDVRQDVGDLRAALEFGEAALTLFETTSDLNGLASTIADVGHVHVARNDGIRAIAHFKDAAARYRSLRYSSREARSLIALADAQIAVHAVDEAREALLLARELYHGLGDSVGTDAADARLRALDA
jgi:tetratricopeptide (TPR) repeat protein